MKSFRKDFYLCLSDHKLIIATLEKSFGFLTLGDYSKATTILIMQADKLL